MAVEIIPFEESLWPGVKSFLHNHWQQEHPLCRRELFFWQYRGFGDASGVATSRIAVTDGQIIGFLGAIPGRYLFDGRVVNGVALALWVVHPEYRNRGLGMLLLREVEKQAQVVVCLGLNPKVIRFYTATGYKYLPALNRYVRPLDPDAYSQLLPRPVNEPEVTEWLKGADEPGGDEITPQPIEPVALFTFWQKTHARFWKLALWRAEDFWTWRYVNAVGFRYLFFGGMDRAVVVARLEKITGTDKPALDGRPVLRIIEYLPASLEGGQIATEPTCQLLRDVLRWARRQGGVAADFQCTSTRFETPLSRVGFKRRTTDDPATHLPELFNPLRYGVAPINAVVKTKRPIDLDFNDVYLVKSDGDMDRPSRWPVD